MRSAVTGIEVRVAAFSEIGVVQAAVLRPHGPLPGDRPAAEGAVHVGAFVGATAIGAATVVPAPYPGPQVDLPSGGQLPTPTWQLRGMAIVADWRGTGVGARVLAIAVAAARDRGAASLWAAARLAALGFYTGAGWTAVGPVWDKPGVGPHRYITLIAPPGRAG